MATTITNQARLQYTYGNTTALASSNVASTVVTGPLSATKSVLESAYREGDSLTYIVNLTNSGTGALGNVSVVDDLGSYALIPTGTATPLTYVGPAQLYVDGVFNQTLNPTLTASGIIFTIPNIAAGENAMIIYKANVNNFAVLTAGSVITNTATVSADTLAEPLTISASVPVDAYADVSIVKTMSPNPVMDGSQLTYSFTIYNYGNTAATNVVLTDAFNPAPNPITVTVNGTTLSSADYSYAGGTLTIPAAGSGYTLTIPAATYTQDATSGEVTVNPGTINIVVVGTL